MTILIKKMNKNENIRDRIERLYGSLRNHETFSKEIQEQIEKELEKMRQEAIEYNKNKGAAR